MTEKEGSVLDDYSFVPPTTAVEESSRRAGAATTTANSRDELPVANAVPVAAAEYDSSFVTSDATENTARIDITRSVPDEQKHLVTPAGVGGAVLGFLLGGPILSALLGFGSAYAVRKDGTAGDVARSVGEVTISVKDKAGEFEEKHGYGSRTKKAIDDFTSDKSRNSLLFKTRAFVVSTWLATTRYAREHQLLERGVENTGKGMEYVADVIGGRVKKCGAKDDAPPKGDQTESSPFTKATTD